LSSNTPHAFSIFYNANGNVFLHQISGDENVIQAINTRLNEFNEKKKPLPKPPNNPPPVPPKQAPPVPPKKAPPVPPKQAPPVPPKQAPPVPPKQAPKQAPPVPPKQAQQKKFKSVDRSKKSWIVEEVKDIYNAKIFSGYEYDNDFYSNPQKEQYINEIFQKNNDFGKPERKEDNKIFLYYWLGIDCEKNQDKVCNDNMDKFLKIKEKFGNYFIPFFQNKSFNRNDDILKSIQSGKNDIIITLSASQPGRFIVGYKDAGKPKLEILNADLENKIMNINTKFTKYTYPSPGEECISSGEEEIIKDLINDIENKIDDPKLNSRDKKLAALLDDRDLNERYKKIAVKIHPDKINNTNISEKSKERCNELIKILNQLKTNP
jgi:hypothetical protein